MPVKINCFATTIDLGPCVWPRLIQSEVKFDIDRNFLYKTEIKLIVNLMV